MRRGAESDRRPGPREKRRQAPEEEQAPDEAARRTRTGGLHRGRAASAFVQANGAMQLCLLCASCDPMLAAADVNRDVIHRLCFVAAAVGGATATMAVLTCAARSRPMPPLILVATEVFIWGCLLADAYLFSYTKMHLTHPLVLRTIPFVLTDAQVQMDFGLGPTLKLAIAAAVIAGIAVEAALWKVALRLAQHDRAIVAVDRLADPAFAVGLLLLSTTITITAARRDWAVLRALPFNSASELLSTNRWQDQFQHLRPQRLKRRQLPAMRSRPDIVLVVADSFRATNLVPQRMPNIFSIASKRGCILSASHHTAAPNSGNGILVMAY